MALRYFRGRLDLDKLSLADLAEAAGALASLERLFAEGKIVFETGASRHGVARPDMRGGRDLARPQLQKQILVVLREAGPQKFDDIIAATGMPEGSLSANLTLLQREGVVLRHTAERSGRPGRASRSEITYSLTPTPESNQPESDTDGCAE